MTPNQLPPYSVLCHTNNCFNEAVYKIAARWSDGVTSELKTYSLCCRNCLANEYRASKERQARCRLGPGESVEAPGIYQLHRGSRDARLQRLAELEAQLNA